MVASAAGAARSRKAAATAVADAAKLEHDERWRLAEEDLGNRQEARRKQHEQRAATAREVRRLLDRTAAGVRAERRHRDALEIARLATRAREAQALFHTADLELQCAEGALKGMNFDRRPAAEISAQKAVVGAAQRLKARRREARDHAAAEHKEARGADAAALAADNRAAAATESERTAVDKARQAALKSQWPCPPLPS